MSATSWRSRVKHLANTFFNFILPPTCANCDKVGTYLCANCFAAIQWLQEPLCPFCGRIVAHPTPRCYACRQRPLPLQKVRAAVLFTEPIPGIIHKMKYNGYFALAEPLSDLMVKAWPRWQMRVDLVLPIPLHPERQKERGYNQSELLVQGFCQQVNLPTNPKTLQRVRHTQPQVGLKAAERLTNVANAFWADRSQIEGKEILLVDDVYTTGTTLSEAAKALLAAGAKTVSGYCLARAIKN